MTFVLTFEEVREKMLRVFPNASLETDNDGQLIVYTDLKAVKTSEGVTLVEMGDLDAK